MIASSPTTAALLRASLGSSNNSAVPVPAAAAAGGFSPRSRRADGASSLPSQNALSAPSASPIISYPPRPIPDSGFPSGAGARPNPPVQRQMADAGTQYSRPATPIDRLVRPSLILKTKTQAGSTPSSTLTDASNTQSGPAFSNGGSSGSGSSFPMPGVTTGSKRNTPDMATVSTKVSSARSCEAQSGGRDAAQGSNSKRLRPEIPAPTILPPLYEDADPRDLVFLISSMLMELIQYNDQIPLRDGRLTRFHSRSPPRISVTDYLQRLTTHATLSPPILLSMVYYIDRLCALYPAFTISSLTVHRFLISAATVASKGLSDSFWTNKTYARVGGITVAELALLELEFLWRVEWRIVPQPEVLVDYYRSLVERCDEYILEPEIKSEEKSAEDCKAGISSAS